MILLFFKIIKQIKGLANATATGAGLRYIKRTHWGL
jgi:hypothetical protein